MYAGSAIFVAQKSYATKMRAIVERGHCGILKDLKPASMADDIWTIVGACWTRDPNRRPEMEDVVGRLKIESAGERLRNVDRGLR